MKSTSLISICLLVSLTSCSQNSIILERMEMSYFLGEDSIEITLSAPTEGWLAVGFNKKNNIVGTDLLMMHLKDGQAQISDRFTSSIGIYPPDIEQGGQSNVRLLKATEQSGRSTFTFSIPRFSLDRFDFQHTNEKPFWLILAYSTHDDFDHHSIMRKHTIFKWQPME